MSRDRSTRRGTLFTRLSARRGLSFTRESRSQQQPIRRRRLRRHRTVSSTRDWTKRGCELRAAWPGRVALWQWRACATRGPARRRLHRRRPPSPARASAHQALCGRAGGLAGAARWPRCGHRVFCLAVEACADAPRGHARGRAVAAVPPAAARSVRAFLRGRTGAVRARERASAPGAGKPRPRVRSSEPHVTRPARPAVRRLPPPPRRAPPRPAPPRPRPAPP